MSEPSAKRFKQSSLTDYSFKKNSKPKLPKTNSSLITEGGNEVIVLSDSQSDQEHFYEKMEVSDNKKGSTQSLSKTSKPINDIGKTSSTKESKMYKSEDVDNESGGQTGGVHRKRPLSESEGSPEAGTSTAVVGEIDSNKITDTNKITDKYNSPKVENDTVPYSMSPDLFSDSEPLTDSQEVDDLPSPPASTMSTEKKPLGVSINQLKKTSGCSQRLPPLKPNPSHTVLFQVPYQFTSSCLVIPLPYPSSYTDDWGERCVRMPCSNLNEYPVNNTIKRRWELIETALKKQISNPSELEVTILSYNTRYATKWDFSALKRLLREEFSREESEKFFKHTLRNMAQLALKLPHLCTQGIPLLKKGITHSITLSQQQIACLLANAFFCTFPRRNTQAKSSEYASYPDINFSSLYSGSNLFRKYEKLKCILNYFKRVADPTSVPLGTVTFTRQTLQQLPDWKDSETQLRDLHVATDGVIEIEGEGMLQVDFANKFVGGGVLRRGCVQEEIRFLICPEMIVSRLFTEVLEKNECLIMTGCERYSSYTGYADSFKWSGDYIDCTERDEWGRCRTEVVAIDALVIRSYKTQFQAWSVKRELDKAYCGFYKAQTPVCDIPAICTGNWGCGAFGGEKQLKALIQVMAASEAGRDVCYLTFGDSNLQKQLYEIHSFLKDDQTLCIGDILKIIQQYYRQECEDYPTRPAITLFNYIYKVFDYQDDTTEEDTDETSQEGMSTQRQGHGKKGKLSTTDSVNYKAETP